MFHGQEFNIFISYRGNSEGGLLGSKIYSDLLHYTNGDNKREFKPFFAPACISKGENFKEAIQVVLQDAKCFIMIIDEDYFKNCGQEDDMVSFELVTALKHKDITFLPIVFSGFSFDKNAQLHELFSADEVNRFKHINAINYYGIYDFRVEVDLIPVIDTILSKQLIKKESSSVYRFDLDNFKIVRSKTISFGKYPQNVVSDMSLIDKIASGVFTGETIINSNTNLLTYDGNQYATIAENPFNKMRFDNGKEVNAGARNYFLSEPISWDILFENDEYYFLISTRAIDAIQFNLNRSTHVDESNNTYAANNWEHSYIRRWLNSEFYYRAFSENERQRIELVEVDNSDESGFYKSTSKNTVDRIFLVSHKEIFAFGSKGALTTDYAKARGGYASTSASHYGKGDWWTRSPGVSKDSIENIDRRGTVDSAPFCNFVDDTAASVRPCLIIKK